MSTPKHEPNGVWIGAAAVILAALIGATAQIYTTNNKTPASPSGTSQTSLAATPPITKRDPSTSAPSGQPVPVPQNRPPVSTPITVNTLSATKINPKDGAEMILIPAGVFIMGSNDGLEFEKPQRNVYLDGYYIYKNLVTVTQYRTFCEATGRAMPPAPEWGWNANHPIVNVSWEDSDAYCKWAGEHLPTEAQWEKAARGVDGSKYPWGNEWDENRLQCSKKVVADAKSTAPVGSFPSGVSPYGVMDMAGNVWQWCADWFDENYYKSAPERNPIGPNIGTLRVKHGGSWFNANPDYFYAALRSRVEPSNCAYNVGFRCASGL